MHPISIGNKVIILSCGGTINMVRSNEGAVDFSNTSQTSSLLNSSANTQNKKNQTELASQVFLSVPSSEMSLERVLNLAKTVFELSQNQDTLGIVITHGTDALEDTAFVLGLTLSQQTNCPIVLIAAMKPSDDPNYDGLPNLEQALVWIKQFKQDDVYYPNLVVIMSGQAHTSTNTFKQHTSNCDAFNNDDCVAQFDSKSQTWQIKSNEIAQLPKLKTALQTKQSTPLPRVEIVNFCPGDDAVMINMIATQLKPKAIVINALGCGNVNQAMLTAIETLIQQGTVIVIASRVPYGHTFAEYAYAGGGASLQKSGAIFSGRLRANQAKLLLHLCFLEEITQATQIARQFDFFATTKIKL